MFGDADGIGHDGEGRVDRADGRHEGSVDDVEVVEVMGLAPGVQDAVCGILAKTAGSHLMGGGGDIHGLKEDHGEAGPVEDTAPLGTEAPVAFAVFGLPGEANMAVAIEGDPVAGIGQVFGSEPPIHGVAGSPGTDGEGEPGLLGTEQRRRDLAEILDVAEGIGIIGVARIVVKVVDGEGLLEDGGVFLGGFERHAGAVEMAHVVAPDLVAAVGEALGCDGIGGSEEDGGRVYGAGGEDDDSGAQGALIGVHTFHALAVGIAQQAQDTMASEQANVGVRQGGGDAADFGIAFGVQQAREAVTGGATHAGAMGGVFLVALEGEGEGKGVQPHIPQFLLQGREDGFMAEGRKGKGAAGRFQGVGTGLTVGEVPGLGLVIVGREIGVSDRPSGGEAVAMAARQEVFYASAQNGGPVELGVAPHMVAGYGGKWLARAVAPLFVGVVAVFGKDGAGIPVAPFAGEVVAAFEDEEGQSRGSEGAGQGAATGAAADDDYIGIEASRHGGNPDR